MSAQATQPIAGTWQQEFARQPFRQRLTWLQNLAAAALALTVSVNVLFGIINGRRLERIEHGHYPLMQTTRSLEVTLWRLQRELQGSARELERMGREGLLAGASERFNVQP